MTKPAKQARPVDLSEYVEEAVPFDAVIRRLAKVKPTPPTAKHKPSKAARKRK